MTRLLGQALETIRPPLQHPIMRQSSREWLVIVVFVIMVVPAGPNHVLIPMLALTCAIGGLLFLATDRAQLETRAPLLLFACAGGVLALHGFLRSNPGWSDVAVPLVGGPIAWFLISQLADEWWAERVPEIVSVATITISLMVLSLNLKIGDELVRWIEPGAFSFRGQGRSRTNLVGLTTLISTIPILLSLLLDHFQAKVPLRRIRLHVAALVLSAPAVLLSGRQGLVGAIALFPALLLLRRLAGFGFERKSSWSAQRMTAAGAVILAGLLVPLLVLNLSPVALVADALASAGIGDGVSSRVAYSARVRSVQSSSLIEGFLEQPIIGQGAGAVSPDFYTWRGFEIGSGFLFEPRPWRAEVSYQLLLFEGGVVGALLYLAAIAGAGLMVRRQYRRLQPTHQAILRAVVVGALSILIGAAFNPHLRAVGAQVLLFLPVIVAGGLARTPSHRRTTSS